jgi:hypothetical protein
MLDCLILGDEIAGNLANYRTECAVVYAPKTNSRIFWHNFKSDVLVAENEVVVKNTIISLGMWDDKVYTEPELRELRKSIVTDHAVWIMPSRNLHPEAHTTITIIAQEYNDTMLTVPYKDLDNKHKYPTDRGYRNLAKGTQ